MASQQRKDQVTLTVSVSLLLLLLIFFLVNRSGGIANPMYYKDFRFKFFNISSFFGSSSASYSRAVSCQKNTTSDKSSPPVIEDQYLLPRNQSLGQTDLDNGTEIQTKDEFPIGSPISRVFSSNPNQEKLNGIEAADKLLPNVSSSVIDSVKRNISRNNSFVELMKENNSASYIVNATFDERLANSSSANRTSNHHNSSISRKRNNQTKACDIYSGKWVKDDSYPVYRPSTCPYVDEAFDCQRNGRPDSEYMKWRWQPHGCQLPRFDGPKLLERLRGKRLMFVGDSMNRNQFESLLCLLREGLHNKSRMFEIHGYRITKGRGFYVFKFPDYNCTMEFTRTHFLVREGRKVRPNGRKKATLMIDKIDKTSVRWKKADILIFNTGHWWNHGKTEKGKDYFQEGDVVLEKLDVLTAFRKAMLTWANWVDKNIDRNRTIVFFRGYSPAHYKGGEWNGGGKCHRETQPITAELFSNDYSDKMHIVENVIGQMSTPVRVLNISRLTYFRKDGHPSIYGKHYATAEEVKNARYQDCSHWCLPGIPDVWNQIICSSLLNERLYLLEDGGR